MLRDAVAPPRAAPEETETLARPPPVDVVLDAETLALLTVAAAAECAVEPAARALSSVCMMIAPCASPLAGATCARLASRVVVDAAMDVTTAGASHAFPLCALIRTAGLRRQRLGELGRLPSIAS